MKIWREKFIDMNPVELKLYSFKISLNEGTGSLFCF